MAFIGNSVQNQGFAPAVDYFNGDGTTVTFTLSRPVASVAQLTAVIENVIQNPTSAFTVSGNQLTFTSAPPAGTNNIWVEYTSLITQYNGISQDPSVVGDITASGGYLSTGDFGNSYLDGTIVDYVTGNARITTGASDNMTFYHGGTSSRQEMMSLYYAGGAKIFGNTALTIPVGTTAQRPGTPATGMTRYNTTTSTWEAYIDGGWQPLNSSVVTNYQQFTSSTTWTVPAGVKFVNVLIVGGGGGGGTIGGGGGGGGGVVFVANYPVTPGASVSIVVGAGGAPATTAQYSQFNGDMIAWGGGGGSTNTDTSFGNLGGPKLGASGGGAGATSTQLGTPAPGSSQGSAGGWAPIASPYPAGGGGGAGSVGGNGTGSTNGPGGTGVFYKMFAAYGQSGWFGGGGGGGYQGNTLGAAGLGGGGAGNVAGTANTGGGGGGVYTTGTNGGSGVVIVAWYQ